MGNQLIVEVSIHDNGSIISGSNSHNGINNDELSDLSSFMQDNRLRSRIHNDLFRLPDYTHRLQHLLTRFFNLTGGHDTYGTDQSEDDFNLAKSILESIAPTTSPGSSTKFSTESCPICFYAIDSPHIIKTIVEKRIPNTENTNDCISGLISSFLVGMIRKLPCGHVYHQSCIDAWLIPRFGNINVNVDCPVCRRTIE